jgi:hypothetical protein
VVIFLIIIGIPVIRDACPAFSDEKKGVSKDTHSTAIPCLRKINADKILSRPPEQRPKALTFPECKFMIYAISILDRFKINWTIIS